MCKSQSAHTHSHRACWLEAPILLVSPAAGPWEQQGQGGGGAGHCMHAPMEAAQREAGPCWRGVHVVAPHALEAERGGPLHEAAGGGLAWGQSGRAGLGGRGQHCPARLGGRQCHAW